MSETAKAPEDMATRQRRRLEALHAHLAEIDRADANLSRLRGLAFLGTGVLSVFALFQRSASFALGAGTLAAMFLVFVVRHARVASQQFELARRLELLRRSVARCEGSYRAPTNEPHRLGLQHLPDAHPYARDLDLFGPRSIFEQLDVTETRDGSGRLAAWLLAPAAPDVVHARQEAIRELAAKESFREAIALAGMRGRGTSSPSDTQPVLTWAAAPRVSLPVVALAALLLAQLALGIANALGATVATRAWGFTVALQIVAMAWLRPRTDAVIAPIAAHARPLGGHANAMATCEAEPFASSELLAQQARLTARGGAAEALFRLESAIGLAAVRHNALAHFLANAFLMWDAWAAWRLERWRSIHGSSVAVWLDALAEFEALSALGTYSAEHPGFAWPRLSHGSARFEARELGHPLLPADRRVPNDIVIGDPPAWLVTGSNMSGKSTLLRSVGVATVLAQAGAPVAARALDLSPLRVRTSMRIDDSLAEGASHFLAEVRRLKAVLDDASAPGPAVLFLLDEVLHGTNSRERIIGASSVVRHLIEHGAIGAVSSHDLGLVPLERETGGGIRNVHFQEHVEDGRMAFDFRMRPGPVRTSNALRLMREVGIDCVPVEPRPQPTDSRDDFG